ncbi:MAG: TonB-dependent receptor plug domain-containing protein [Bacteroidales bacterium]|nr:TonB-dependent receptor plug domain-containing protein [Bacteroidales bacterium]
MTRRLIIVLLLLAGAVCSAQTPLYRGRTMVEYNFPFNGHYFWDTPDFRPGRVFFNGDIYEGVMLNVNAHTGDLLARESLFTAPVVVPGELVPWFELDGVRYVNLRLCGVQDAPEGFFQVLRDQRETVYHQRIKFFAREPGDHNGPRGIGYDDPHYRENIIAYFHLRDNYYAVRRGTFKQIHPSRRRASRLQPVPEAFASAEAPLEQRTSTGEPSIRVPGARPDLPPEWFSTGEISSGKRAILEAIEQETLIANYRNKTYEIGRTGSSKGPVTVSGTVRDVATGEELPTVLVTDSSGRIYTYTDDRGAYSLKLPLGENLLSFRETTKEDMDIHVIVRGEGSLDIVMREKVTALKSAYVTANSMAEHRRAGMGLETINSNIVSHIPSAFGEGDVIKAVLTLPGVKSVGEASSGFNVRGGSSDQNLILFNGGTIYNPSHLFGVFSAFNNEILDGVELYKSSIPVQYGGRISSVLDITTRDGSTDRVRGSLGIGILTSHATIEGPIGKGGKTTFVLGGRTTYSDWLLKRLPANSGYAGGNASFSDVNIGVTHRFDERNSLKLTGYWSRDDFSFRGDTTFRYSNLDVALKWRHKLSGNGTLDVSTGFDRYSNILDRGYKTDVTGAWSLATDIRQGFLRAGVKQRLGTHTLSWGGDAVFYALNPGTISPTDSSLVVPRALPPEMALEPAIYLGDQWQPQDSPFSLDYGLRLSSFLAFAPMKFYGGPELRVSGKYSPLANLSIKAGFNTMNQYIHLISNTSSISPMDTWRLSGADILPQKGWQAASGIYWTVFGNELDISIEGYWKQMDNYLDYKSGAVLSMNEHLADDLVRTRGKSYGVELMLKKLSGRLTGWVSYTWSRAMLQEMGDRGPDTINGGAWYNAPYDKPHDVKLVGNYKFTHRYSLSFNLDYSTGRPVTVPVGQYYYGNALRLMYSDRNAYRIPDYFRLDLAFNIEPGHYLKAFTHMSATIGCYNVTGRHNAYSVFYTTGGGTGVKGYLLSVFATQVPYLSLNLKF